MQQGCMTGYFCRQGIEMTGGWRRKAHLLTSDAEIRAPRPDTVRGAASRNTLWED